MACIIFNMAELTTARFACLQETLRIPRAEALGLLVLFWDETRRRELEQADYEVLHNCIPLTRDRTQDCLNALIDAGYLERTPEGSQLLIVDNKGFVAKRQKRRADGSVAGLAAHAKKKKTSTRRTKKVQTEEFALVAPADNVALSATLASAKTPEQKACAATWQAYAEAYKARIGQWPTRNAKTNSLIMQFVRRIGHDEAPKVITFYVQHPDKRFTGDLYMLDMAVKKAESLRAQWANNRAVTHEMAGYFDRANTFEMQQARIEAGEI